MRLILAWSEAARRPAGVAEPDLAGVEPPRGHAGASLLSRGRSCAGSWISSRARRSISPRLQELVPEEYAAHWQLTLDFLAIVTEHWPDYLADNGLVSPVARRNMLMALETERARAAILRRGR